MSSFLDRWEEVDLLLKEVLDLPPAEQSRFLDEMCRDDAELRGYLDSLLAAAAVDQTVFDAGAEALAVDLLDEVEADVSLVGHDVGPYRIVRELGTGGMGAVYLAERTDGLFAHQVAVKIVRRGRASAEVLRRFRHERQVLASLQHPNIAALHDGGLLPEGLPYLTMEYVEGVPITDYCDRHRLAPRARLRLFRTVCRAVQFAHQNLVIHRDLKPSNILVTEDGTVKLLDFGIAKLLDGAATPAAPVTQAGMYPMTPEYASPEQLRGEAVTTASDVYALGVLLYELLTGVRPFDLPHRLQHEAVRILLEEEPTRPSTALTATRRDADTATAEAISQARATTVEQLQRQLRGDLDNIALKALAKTPDRRYATADQLSEDLQRYLTGLPVEARPATFRYHAAKFIRRHRTGVLITMGAFVLMALLVGFYTSRLADERDLARLEAEKQAALTDYLVSVFNTSNPNSPAFGDLSAQDLLDQGATRIGLDLADQPAIQAEMLTIMGQIYRHRSDFPRAEALLDSALVLLQQLHPTDHPELARAYFERATLFRQVEQFAQAESLHLYVLNIRRRFAEAQAHRLPFFERGSAERAEQEHALTESLNELGILYDQRKQYDEAEAMHREALAIRQRLAGPQSYDVSFSLHNLGLVLRHQEKYEEAVQLLTKALNIRREVLGEAHPMVAENMNSVGSAYLSWGKYAEAESFFREALARQRQVLPDGHHRLATTLGNLGYTVDRQGRATDGILHYEEAIAILRAAYGVDHPRVGLFLGNLGEIYQRMGAADQALEALTVARDIREQAYGPDDRRTLGVLHRIGNVHAQKGEYEEAIPKLRTVLSQYETRYEEGDRDIVQVLHDLGEALLGAGQTVEAEALLRQALAYREAALAADNPDLLRTHEAHTEAARRLASR